MEFNEFDQMMKDKVGQAQSYEKEINDTQPYVWAAVQQNLYGVKRERKWYYMVAALILLLISFGSLLLWQMQSQHHEVMAVLKSEIETLQSQNIAQAALIDQKAIELENEQELGNEKEIENELKLKNELELEYEQEFEERVKAEPQYIVLRDTVYIETIKYLQQEIANPQEQLTALTTETTQVDSNAAEESLDRSVAIYPQSPSKVQASTSSTGVGIKLAELSKP